VVEVEAVRHAPDDGTRPPIGVPSGTLSVPLGSMPAARRSSAAPAFAGFRPEATDFLVALALNNDRAWFQPRKAQYERLLKEPLEALCVALADRFAARGIPLVADPRRSPFRIHRDVRFSRDKRPYKTNIGAGFPWAGEGDTSAGGYFHLQPGETFVGGGMWHPERTWLQAWRRAVDQRPQEIHAVLDEPRFVATFGAVGGDRLSRAPSGYPADHPEIELLRHKDVTFGRRLTDAEVRSARLPDRIAELLEPAVPVMRLLATIG
jgi:uncharacterized protein (TIGR02453 family)